MLLENIRLAATALRNNKLRTLLTMLGIIIGIASVITIMTVGDAMNRSVQDSMGGQGATNIEMYLTEKIDEEEEDEDESNVREVKDSDQITEDMLEQTMQKFQGKLSGALLTKELGNAKVQDGNRYANITVNGMNRAALEQKNLKILAGRTLRKSDLTGAANVALVSDKYVNNMYQGDYEKAPGQTVEAVINNNYYNYTIVGVYQYNASDFDGFSSGESEKRINTQCIIPLKTAVEQSRKEDFYSDVTFTVQTGVDPEISGQEISDWMNQKYYKNNDAYETGYYTQNSALESMRSMVSTVKAAFMAVGAISLLVGGIGVMNIMIVSITERTREIGTRKALGATNGSICAQFITEAVVVCLAGGLIGIGAGVGLGTVVSRMMKCCGMPSVYGIIGCVFFSMAIGVFFGFYPARKAAKLNPVEALRYE